jgi:hypothetical protein
VPHGRPAAPVIESSRPADPEPVVTDPEPVVTDPEPVVTDPELALVDPEPAAADPEPAPSLRVAADPAPAASTAPTDAVPGPTAPTEPGAPAALPEPARPRPSAAQPAADVRPGAGADQAYRRLVDGGDVIRQAERLTPQPVDQLSYLRRGRHVQLSWIWPDDSLAARVQWHCDGDPPGRVSSARCLRRVYEHDGGFEVAIGHGGATVTVEALVPGDELADRPPSALRLEALAPIVAYEPTVRRGFRQWTVTVTFSSEVDCTLPPTLLVLGTGSYRPTSTRDGAILHEFPAGHLRAREPLVVSFETSPLHRPCWLVCLPADPDESAADLQPVALHKLRVR